MAQKQIQEAVASLEQLRKKIAETQAQITSLESAFGLLGTEEKSKSQLKNLETAINSVKTQLAELTQIATTAGESIGTKGFGTKSLENFNAKLNEIYANIGRVQKTTGYLSGKITGPEKTSSEVRAASQKQLQLLPGLFTPEQQAKIAKTTGEVARLIQEANQMNVVFKETKFSDTMVNGVLKANIALVDANGKVRTLGLSFNEDGELIGRATKKVEEFRDKLNQIRGTATPGGTGQNTTTIPRAGRDVEPDLPPTPARSVNAREEALKSFNQQISRLGLSVEAQAAIVKDYEAVLNSIPGSYDKAGESAIVFANGVVKVNTTLQSSTGLTAKAAESYNAAGKALRGIGTSLGETLNPEEMAALQGRFGNAFAYAKRLGFGQESLQKVTELPTGTEDITNTALKFKTTMGGISREVNLTVDSLGRVIPEVSRRFRTFTQSVIRDFRELAKWTIAISLIYGPLNEVSKITQLMIKNQSELADIMIVVNSQFVDQAQVFDSIVKSAQQTGTAINDVAAAFQVAYRAVGSITDQQERYRQSTILLNDALTLSKLTGTSQADAVDTLSAALRQLGMPLTSGATLLDKWVKVSKIANVDIGTLATGFSVLGETADAAGLSVDKLNAVVAALSEATPYSGREAANSIRFLIGAYQQASSIDALSRYGIAVKDVTGQVRDFLTVYEEIGKLQSVLPAGQYNQLLAVVGGGSRGAAKAGALIANLPRVNEIEQQSLTASGDAATALAKKLDTVETSLTRLQNATQSFAQSLGDKGGLLNLFQESIDLVTTLVTGLDKLASVMGRAGPLLAGLGIARLALGGADVMTARLNNLGIGLVDKFPALAGIAGRGFVPGTGVNTAEGFQEKSLAQYQSEFLSRAAASQITQYAVAAVLPLIAAYGNYKQGNPLEAGANLIGGGIGIGVAALTGNPQLALIGGAIGSAIAEAFVKKTITYSEPLANAINPAYQVTPVNAPSTAKPFDVEKALGNTLQRFEANFAKNTEAQDKFNEYIAKGYTFTPTSVNGTPITGVNNKFRNAQLSSPESISNAIARGYDIAGTFTKPGEQQAFNYESLPSKFRALFLGKTPEQQRQIKFDIAGTDQGTQALDVVKEDLLNKYNSFLLDIQTKTRDALTQQLITGEITPAQYGKSVTQFTPERAAKLFAAGGQEFIDLSKNVDNTSQALEAFALILSKGSDESNQYITSFAETIADLTSKLQEFPAGTTQSITNIAGDTQIVTKDELAALIKQYRSELGALLTQTLTETSLSQYKVPGIVGPINQPVQKKYQDIAIQEGLKLQQQYLDTVFAGKPDELNAYMAKIEDFVTLVTEGGKTFYDTAHGIQQDFYNAGQQSAEQQGLIPSGAFGGGGIGFQQYNLSTAQINALVPQANALAEQLKSKFGYQPQYESQIAIPNNGQPFTIHTDLKVLQLLLEKIVDQNQKQLDGQYNIPEGATFWVPLTAAYYRYQGGGGGMGGLDLSANTTATDANTAALNSLYQAMTAAASGPYYTSEKLNGSIPLKPQAQFPPYENSSAYRTSNYSTRMTAGTAIGGGTGTQENILTQVEQTINDILEPLKFLLSPLNKLLQPLNPNNLLPNGTPKGNDTGLSAPMPRVSINLNSTTTLTLDGRTVATAVKTYLLDDILRSLSAYGNSSKNYFV